jgi:ribosomal protein S27E
MNEEPVRFTDTGEALADLATHFIVQCPKCGHKAWVRPYRETWRLTCTACFHVEEPGHWYGAMTAYVSVKCRECRNPLTRSAPVDGTWKKLKMKCDKCGDECEYEAHLSRHWKHNGLMTDPKFGLPLWLQQEMSDELFWAFNYEQLELLEHYVRAKLRERGISPRNTIKKSSAMVARLPSFITGAHRRDEVLAVIGKLQKK